jgi:hypothetical protein
MRDTVIHRQKKKEAEIAINDLLNRGFKIVYPLTEITRDGKQFRTDSYGRKIFMNNSFTSCWVAKLRRIEQ